MNDDRRDQRHEQDERWSDRPQEPEGHQGAAHRFAERGGGGEQTAGTKAQLLEEPAGAGETVAAEPAEQLLGAVRSDAQAKEQSPDEECRVHVFLPCRDMVH